MKHLVISLMLAAPLAQAQALKLEKGDSICLIGNALAERMQHDGWLETLIQSRFPALELSFFDADASADGYTIVPLQGDYDCWTCVLDEQGRPVWASEIPCQTHRTRFAPDGSGFVSHYQTSPDNPVQLRSVSFFGDEVSEIPVEDAHHDFAIVDENTTAVLGYTERLVQIGDEELRLVGDTIIEVGPYGSAEVIWDLFDHVAIDPDLPFPESAWREGTFECSHSNYLTYSADQDAYLITDRSVEAIYKVDRSTGAHLWTLADNLGDFEVHDEQALVEFPHSIEPIDGGLLLFNQGHPLDDDCSEALEIEIDTQAGTASRGWTYETEDCLLTEYLGNAWRLDNGNTLAVFTKLGQMDEVTADGALVQRLNTGMGWWLSYAERVSSLYAR